MGLWFSLLEEKTVVCPRFFRFFPIPTHRNGHSPAFSASASVKSTIPLTPGAAPEIYQQAYLLLIMDILLTYLLIGYIMCMIDNYS